MSTPEYEITETTAGQVREGDEVRMGDVWVAVRDPHLMDGAVGLRHGTMSRAFYGSEDSVIVRRPPALSEMCEDGGARPAPSSEPGEAEGLLDRAADLLGKVGRTVIATKSTLSTPYVDAPDKSPYSVYWNRIGADSWKLRAEIRKAQKAAPPSPASEPEGERVKLWRFADDGHTHSQWFVWQRGDEEEAEPIEVAEFVRLAAPSSTSEEQESRER